MRSTTGLMAVEELKEKPMLRDEIREVPESNL